MRSPENMQNLCICGHVRWAHFLKKYTSLGYCHSCSFKGGGKYMPNRRYIHEFKLDNLWFVEQIAKERNLV